MLPMLAAMVALSAASAGASAASGSKKEGNAENEGLAEYARALMNESSGLRRLFNEQGLEALRTGGVTTKIPLILRALNTAKAQRGVSDATTVKGLERFGLVGTPFGQMIRTKANIAANDRIANIPTDIAGTFTKALPGYVGAMTRVGMSGMGDAAGAQTGVTNSYNNSYSQILSASMPKTSVSYAG